MDLRSWQRSLSTTPAGPQRTRRRWLRHTDSGLVLLRIAQHPSKEEKEEEVRIIIDRHRRKLLMGCATEVRQQRPRNETNHKHIMGSVIVPTHTHTPGQSSVTKSTIPLVITDRNPWCIACLATRY